MENAGMYRDVVEEALALALLFLGLVECVDTMGVE